MKSRTRFGRLIVSPLGSTALAAVILLAPTTGCRGIRAGRGGGQQPTSIFQAFSPPTPAEAVAWATDEYDPDKRYRGTLLLANAPWGGEPVYLELYRKASADPDPGVRSVAIRGLALHGTPADVPLILNQIDDDAASLRWECARALQRLHNPEAVPALLRRLDITVEQEPIVREAAAGALAQYPQERVLDGLIAALRDRDLSVSRTANDSLRTLSGQDLGENFRAWVAWKKQTPDPFKGRQPYVYPIFYRDRTFIETVLPFWTPPNEIAASPVGMDPNVSVSPRSPQPEDESVRNNQ